ncbi:hypothetical protein L4174_000510 [Photobacterium sp. CCB-ST2H9]|uniref:hypothetical protein n=1 Tax=Photobacterium sp. CCB-ST2H9 TaxID=2912855 RepID=UPI0020068933|nr:hypothetical protein [Photobacterium sp. CCB-ST2H9]UTM57413.1 hypothetical protein L4174_000510 [Photobacterium sp. CCB-ST2H9]
MRKTLLTGLLFLATSTVNAEIVNTQLGLITDIYSWGKSEVTPSVDGDTLIKIPTELANCPGGVYIQHSEYSDKLLSMAMAAYFSNQTVRFQVWNDADKIWGGSKENYCKVRSIRLTKK